MASPKLMDKDEQLQLCIQRFVSDTQSMINQFSEVLVGELRRFADVCMEFSVAYRGVQEDRQFLTAENKSLKDELDARTAEVDFLGKELREIREENDELIRKLESLNINSEGEISVPSNAARQRHYSVVNSMPAFPRRYSEAIGYDPPASSVGLREVSIELNLSNESSIPSTSKTQILLTPPVAFKNRHPSTLSPNVSGYETTTNTTDNSPTTRSHSRDDISLYNHLGTLANSSSTTSERSPSVDEIRSVDKRTTRDGGLVANDAGLQSINSSAGTFYDCCSRFNIDIDDNTESDSNQHNLLLTVTDQIRQMFGTIETTNNNNASRLTELTLLSEHQNDGVVDPNKCRREHLAVNDGTNNKHLSPPMLINDQFPSMIAKSPSPNNYTLNKHYDKYRCDTNNNNVDGSKPETLDLDDAAFLKDAPPVQRYNSKKISKKRKNRRKTNGEDCVEDVESPVVINNHPTNLTNGSTPLTPIPLSVDAVSIIPLPQISLNRYLLVEVCHVISPSHFYLIINDEKIGTNAFEDFLERFQNFYKSIEETEFNGGFGMNGVELCDEERELRLLVSIPPPAQALTIGSYWACYIDEELDWRRIQVIDIGADHKDLEPLQCDDTLRPEDMVLVRDVDSGYSSLVHSQMIRPLTDEMARVPAFAIRASLAFIHPKCRNREDNINANCSNSGQYYEQWPLECCQLFEDMTYDQILTASVLKVVHDPDDSNEVAQVLIWCTSAEDFEILINRKLIELNYASNIAQDDSWMEQFNDLIMTQTSISQLPPPPLLPPAESANIQFNIQLTSNPTEANVSSFQTTPSPSTMADHLSNGPLDLNHQQERVNNEGSNNKEHQQQQRKIKIKTRSKKKKGPLNEAKDENKECPKPSVGQQAQAAPTPMIEANNSSSTNQETKRSSFSTTADPNLLMELPVEPNVQVRFVASPKSQKSDQSQITVENSSYYDKFSQTLHHDPRLSNWIVQKHSRHVTLKKTLPDTISYLLHISCYFEPDKFIGILPFGERRMDQDLMYQFISDSKNTETPFKKLINEMTGFYQKHYQSNESPLRLLPEQCVFEQANSSTIVFYENNSGLFLRGHIIGRDNFIQIDTDDEESKPKQQINKSKDFLKIPGSVDCLAPQPTLSNKKTLSLKRKSIHDSTTKFIIYAIDAGRYFQVQLKHIYHLEDRFKMAKPFAIVCKLKESNQKSSPDEMNKLIEANPFFGLRFIDTDFSTERFLVELYTVNFDITKSSKPSIIIKNITTFL